MRTEEEIRQKLETCKQNILRLVASGIFTEDELMEYTDYMKALNYINCNTKGLNEVIKLIKEQTNERNN